MPLASAAAGLSPAIVIGLTAMNSETWGRDIERAIDAGDFQSALHLMRRSITAVEPAALPQDQRLRWAWFEVLSGDCPATSAVNARMAASSDPSLQMDLWHNLQGAASLADGVAAAVHFQTGAAAGDLHARINLAWLLWRQGQWANAGKQLDALPADDLAASDPSAQLSRDLLRCRILLSRGRALDAETAATRVMTYAARLGAVHAHLDAQCLWITALLLSGQCAQFRNALPEAESDAAEQNSTDAAGWLTLLRACYHLITGQTAAARDASLNADSVLSPTATLWLKTVVGVCYIASCCSERAGSPAAADVHIGCQILLSAAQPHPPAAAVVEATIPPLATAAGVLLESTPHFAAAIQHSEESESPPLSAYVQWQIAQHALSQAQSDDPSSVQRGLAAANRALTGLIELDLPHFVWRIHAVRARLHDKRHGSAAILDRKGARITAAKILDQLQGTSEEQTFIDAVAIEGIALDAQKIRGHLARTTDLSFATREASARAPGRRGMTAEESASTVEIAAPRHVDANVRLWEALWDVSLRMKRASSLEDLCGEAARAAVELTGAERAVVLELGGSGLIEERAIRFRAGTGAAGIQGVPISRSGVTQALSEQRAVLVTDVAQASEFRDVASIQHLGLMTILAVPLLAPRAAVAQRAAVPVVIGVLYIDSRAATADMPPAALDLVQTLAQHLAAMWSALILRTKLRRELDGYRRAAHVDWPGIVGRDPAMQSVLAVATQVARVDIPILITGETGTGKDTLAKAIHDHSSRAQAPFMYLNFSAIPAGLLEAELFGIETGVATGVEARKGLFEQADGGTVYLDSVGEMDANVQAKLLRFLEDFRIERVGSKRTISTNIRVIASSNVDLLQLVNAGRFRQDLFYRLAGFQLLLPPLRERIEDILPLARSIGFRLATELGTSEPELTADARQALIGHPWPGNIREMENRLRRALIFRESASKLTAADLRLPDRGLTVAVVDEGGGTLTLDEEMAIFDRRYVSAALTRAQGRVIRAAAELGLSRMALHRMMAQLGINYREYRQEKIN